MIPLDLLPRLEAPSGKMLVRAEEMSEVTKTGLYLPPGIRTHTRSAICEVLSDPSGRFEKGARVTLAVGAGRRFYVGYTSAEEVEILVVSPAHVLLRVVSPDIGHSLGQKASWFRGAEGTTEMDMDHALDEKWEEGDPEGLR